LIFISLFLLNIIEVHVLEDATTVVVFTKGLELTPAHTTKVIIVASPWKSQQKGWALPVSAEDDNHKEAAYYTSTDWRIHFRFGCKEFTLTMICSSGSMF
jgi:hypothetical protein